MIYKAVYDTDFVDAFIKEYKINKFSYDALFALYEYYDNFGENIELDPPAIAMDWDEYSTYREVVDDYTGFDGLYDEEENEEDIEEKCKDAVENDGRFTIIDNNKGFILIRGF